MIKTINLVPLRAMRNRSRPLPIIINRQHLPGNRLPPSTFALVRFGGQVALTRFGGRVARPTLKNGVPRGPAQTSFYCGSAGLVSRAMSSKTAMMATSA
jgi:hypothetical protein